MTAKVCKRCGQAMTPQNSNAGCDLVCIPCLLKQAEAYQRTGDARVFMTGMTDPKC